jgi:hypothetical protein
MPAPARDGRRAERRLRPRVVDVADRAYGAQRQRVARVGLAEAGADDGLARRDARREGQGAAAVRRAGDAQHDDVPRGVARDDGGREPPARQPYAVAQARVRDHVHGRQHEPAAPQRRAGAARHEPSRRVSPLDPHGHARGILEPRPHARRGRVECAARRQSKLHAGPHVTAPAARRHRGVLRGDRPEGARALRALRAEVPHRVAAPAEPLVVEAEAAERVGDLAVPVTAVGRGARRGREPLDRHARGGAPMLVEHAALDEVRVVRIDDRGPARLGGGTPPWRGEQGEGEGAVAEHARSTREGTPSISAGRTPLPFIDGPGGVDEVAAGVLELRRGDGPQARRLPAEDDAARDGARSPRGCRRW